jgi:hypothetical protein
MIDVAFVALFAAALLYGVVTWRNRRRSPRVERAREEATKELYRRPSSE